MMKAKKMLAWMMLAGMTVTGGAAQAEGTTCAKAPRRKERRLMGGPDRRARSRETAVETIRRTAQGQGVMKPWRPLYEVQRLS